MTDQNYPLRALYLEDSLFDARVVQSTLAQSAPQIRLEVIPTLALAMQRLKRDSLDLDLVLTDLTLTDGSGLDLLTFIRNRNLPLAVVVLTGTGDQETAVNALKAGADDYLIKKLGSHDMLPAVLYDAHARFKSDPRRRERPIRVLYAEPNRRDADMARRHLARHASHIQLDVVESGDELLALVEQSASPDVLCDVFLLDNQLPGRNALEMIKILRQKHNLSIPVVMVTSHGSEEVAVQALRLGATDYLIKSTDNLKQLTSVLERVQKQTELARSEERYRSLFESHQAIMLIIDSEDGRIINANPAATDWYGWSSEELYQKSIRNIGNISAERFSKQIENVYSQGSGHFKFKQKRADGSIRSVESFSGPVTVPGQKWVFSIIHDVTEKRLAEQSLRRSKAMFHTLSTEFAGLLDAIPDTLMLLDRDLRIVWANNASTEPPGTNPNALVGRHCYSAKYLRETVCDGCLVQKTFDKEQPQQNLETMPDGRTFDIRTLPLKNVSGQTNKVIMIKRDVTEHKKLEMQYLHAQKQESIGTLAAGIAHDFNNILTAISGFANHTLLKMAQDDRLRHNIEQIIVATKRATSLTRQLMLFSRKQPSDRRTVDLNELLSETESFLKRTITADIALDMIPCTTSLPVRADLGQLQQVLMNLTVNACDAMPQGGKLTIRITMEKLGEDFVTCHNYGQPGSYAKITVSDTGTGIDKETQQRIFEPFFTTKTVGQGTGLGLAVVYGLIKQHEGYINVYSEPGHGTTFRIYLPLTTVKGSLELPEEKDEALPGGNETILLAEDEELLRKMLVRVLTDAGYQVITAVDGVDAVRQFQKHSESIQLLLFDLIMPHLNGKQASEQIHKTHPAVKTIFTSGYAPEAIRNKVALNTENCLLDKPIAPNELLKRIRQVLDQDGCSGQERGDS